MYSLMYSVSILRTPSTMRVFCQYVMYFPCILQVFSPCERRNSPYTYRRAVTEASTVVCQEADGEGRRLHGSECT